MKKLLLLAALAVGLASCNDEKHVWVFQDMIYFLENRSETEGYVAPLTKLSVRPRSQAELLVCRNVFAAAEHPLQTVRIEVDERLSTAEFGTDFNLDRQELTFQQKESLQLPLQVTLRSSAAGKKIVLRLDYAYYDECPLDGRRSDRLTITIKEPEE